MQPTLPQTAGTADMDLTAVQSMDWFFKKEQIYLLAQFWQQRATLAEKEVNTLKEQLSTNTPNTDSDNNNGDLALSSGTTANSALEANTDEDLNALSSEIPPNKLLSPSFNNNNTKLLNSVAAAITLHQNGGNLLATTPSPSPPLSDAGVNNGSGLNEDNNEQQQLNGCLNPKLFFNHAQQVMMMEAAAAAAAAAAVQQQQSPMHSPQPATQQETDNEALLAKPTNTKEVKDNLDSKLLSDTQPTQDNNNTLATLQREQEEAEEVEEQQHEEETATATSDCSNNNININSFNSDSKNSVNCKDNQNENKSNKTVGNEEEQEHEHVHQQPDEHVDATEVLRGKLLDNNNYNNNEMKNNHMELLAAKDKEIKALFEEVKRLRSIEQNHLIQIQRLEQHLEAKRQHIVQLESKLDKQQVNEALQESQQALDTKDLSKDCEMLEVKEKKSVAEELHEIIDDDDDDVEDDDDVQEIVKERNCDLTPQLKDKLAEEDEDMQQTENNQNSTDLEECTNSKDAVKNVQIKKETQSPLLLDSISQHNAIAAAAAAAAACNNDPNKFQELLMERTKALVAAEALKNTEDGFTHSQPATHHHQHLPHHQLHHHHHHHSLHHPLPGHLAEQHDKSALNHHDSSASSASTPNLQEQRNHEDHHSLSLNGSLKNLEDNNNSLCATPTGHHMGAGHPSHLPHGFLPGLPFQFQERGHFRFADDLQLPPGTSMAGRLGESLIPKGDPMEAKLQEMLRYNMDKYANQALDTLHISRRVRELLSVHNIGQRIFAKYILGLSQGTVSELLSKPKPWDKLTEKGRDSYRKMHAWSCDDNAVMLLKSLIPKKDSGLPPYGSGGGGGRDDSMSDERIAHILNEASSLMKSSATSGGAASMHQQHEHQRRPSSMMEDSRSNDDSKSPHQPCSSPFYKEHHSKSQGESIMPGQGHMRPEDMNPEKMARLYQELMARAPREAFPGFLLSPFFSGGLPAAGMGANAFPGLASDENMRLAFEREMSKLQQQQQQHAAQPPNFANFSSLMALQQQMLNGAQDLSLGTDDKPSNKDTSSKINGQRSSFEASQNSLSNHGHTTPNAKDSSSTSEVERLYPGLVKAEQGNKTPAPLASSNTSTTNTNSAAPSPLSNSILPPAMTPNEEFSATASPLQRMASITNSLITQPPVPPHHNPPQRPSKAVLPPITQQQFDMFNNLNTEDIVRRVKEALSQYSISQRLFGESVLGLSQGSVSDLLARPKPWHMLTQKGREPFIRMKMFLEDENAVHKLVASQYKIAPEKLMRTGNYSGSPQIPQGLANKMQASLPMQKMMSELKLQEPAHIMQQMQAAAVMSAAMQQHQQQQAAAAQQSQQHAAQAVVQAAQAAAAAQAAQQHHQTMLLTSPGLPPQHTIALPAANSQPSSGSNTPAGPTPDKKPMMMPIHSPHQGNAMRNMHQHMSPTVYEMAALTQDLDTQVITTKIKEALLTNNIGQKIFGEAVLGLSQGSVSELLSKPKPWHMLSIKGREPFIRMQLWLSDANNVERLQVLKNERREASKRRRSTGPNQQDNSSDTSSNDTNDFYTSSPGPGSVGSSGAPPNKKQRVLFSEEQKEALRLAFALDPYPNVGTIEFLANELGLATRTITNWFHNHRMRLKQQVPHGPPGQETNIPTRENTNSTPFDPVQFRILLQHRLLELHKERMGLTGNTPLPYPPYFAAAALLGRSLAGMPGTNPQNALPTNEAELRALNQAFREQMSGLDLSMSSLKRERNDDFEDDMDESHMSENENDDLDEEDKNSEYRNSTLHSMNAQLFLNNMRLNRRKPAAPQWVNPAVPTSNDNERIINGVCVMQNEEEGAQQTALASEEDGNKSLDHDDMDTPHQSLMEPEVVIKQEKEDCESDTEKNNTEDNSSAAGQAMSVEERIKVVQEDKLRMVRVNRLSNEDESLAATNSATTATTAWNY